MKILGISCYYHDSSACILIEGEVVAAAAEERFTRKKHDNSFPLHSIHYCLKEADLAANQLDYIVFYEKPVIKFERLLHQHLNHFPKSFKTFVSAIPSWTNEKLNVRNTIQKKLHYTKEVLFVPHHLSHAASTYYLSDFKDASIVTIDGVGEWTTASIGLGKDQNIHIEKEIRFPHSLGLLYSTITAYLGFRVNNSEYKVMGLAAFGEPGEFRHIFDKLIHLYKDGSFGLELEYFTYEWSERMFNNKLEKLFGYPARKPESEIKSYHQNIAAALQESFEKAVFNILNTAYKQQQNPNLCLAGGTALNSAANGKIIQNTPYKNVYIPPDPGDGGASMGAALYAHQQLTKSRPVVNFTPYLGPSYPWHKIHQSLHNSGLPYKYLSSRKKLVNQVVKYLTEDKVIGWYQGRMEWGPRALGNRSILASAAKEKMRDIINAKIKKREMFRPFAPVILENHIDKLFHAKNQPPTLAKYMLTILPFKSIGKKTIPATVHVNNTGRPQTVNKSDNPLYYQLLKTYYQKTGIPAIINTSFNVRGEPIINTPEEAVNCFLTTDIDILVMDQYIVSKSDL